MLLKLLRFYKKPHGSPLPPPIRPDPLHGRGGGGSAVVGGMIRLRIAFTLLVLLPWALWQDAKLFSRHSGQIDHGP